MHVLLVEDSDPDIELFKLHIDPATELSVAMTLADGVRCAREMHPDIVVLDLYLPDSRGVDTYASFSRDTAQEKPFPVIVYTQSDDADLAKSCIDLGAAAFIGKSQLADSKLSEVMQLAVDINQFRLQSDSTALEFVKGITNRFRQIISEIKGHSK